MACSDIRYGHCVAAVAVCAVCKGGIPFSNLQYFVDFDIVQPKRLTSDMSWESVCDRLYPCSTLQIHATLYSQSVSCQPVPNARTGRLASQDRNLLRPSVVLW